MGNVEGSEFFNSDKPIPACVPSGEIIEINVGGQIFTAFKSTLLKPKGSLLAAIFKSEQRLKDCKNRIFIDRSFVNILFYFIHL